MAEDETFDVTPFEWRRRGHVGECETGKSGNDCEAVNHRSAEWDTVASR